MDQVHVGGAVIRPATLATTAVAGVVVELLALIVLAGVARVGIGPAGTGWDTDGFRVAVLLGGVVVCALAAACGAFAAARVALRMGGDRAARESVLVLAAGAPGGFMVLLMIGAIAGGDAAGAAFLLAVGAVLGAAGGAIAGVRFRGGAA
jgi:hypothetical protein